MKIVESKTQNFLSLQMIGKVVALGTQKSNNALEEEIGF